MALLIFPPNHRAPSLSALLDPNLRQEVAQRVNEALLQNQGDRMKATLYDLVSHRAWAHQKALEIRKGDVPERIDLGFDPSQNGHVGADLNVGSNHNDTVSAGAMATGWEID